MPAHKRSFPTSTDAYRLEAEIGTGVSALVYKAVCIPLGEIVAIKVMDLENTEISALNEIVRETQTMSQLDHPNLVTCHCSFLSGSKLWLVMPFLTGGSVLNIMRFLNPDGGGLSEPVIATIVKEVLKALDYFHRCGNIHRDIKAGNILIDAHGNVKLADFGVSTTCWGSGGAWKAHGTFVGTPCWMAPEVMEQVKGYDFHADIWSLGITIIELAYGHAPFAKYPPMKVMMMTLQNPPQQLEDTPNRHFSRSLRDLVNCCLHKDPKQRPSASKLLEHRFLKEARKPEFLTKNLLEGLPPLAERCRIIKERKAAEERQHGQDAELHSRNNYAKGVSNWDFDVEALKSQVNGSASVAAAPAAASQPLHREDHDAQLNTSAADTAGVSGVLANSDAETTAPTSEPTLRPSQAPTVHPSSQQHQQQQQRKQSSSLAQHSQPHQHQSQQSQQQHQHVEHQEQHDESEQLRKQKVPARTHCADVPASTDLHIGPPSSASPQEQQQYIQQQREQISQQPKVEKISAVHEDHSRSPHKKNVQHKGRFELYEDDDDEQSTGEATSHQEKGSRKPLDQMTFEPVREEPHQQQGAASTPAAAGKREGTQSPPRAALPTPNDVSQSHSQQQPQALARQQPPLHAARAAQQDLQRAHSPRQHQQQQASLHNQLLEARDTVHYYELEGALAAEGTEQIKNAIRQLQRIEDDLMNVSASTSDCRYLLQQQLASSLLMRAQIVLSHAQQR